MVAPVTAPSPADRTTVPQPQRGRARDRPRPTSLHRRGATAGRAATPSAPVRIRPRSSARSYASIRPPVPSLLLDPRRQSVCDGEGAGRSLRARVRIRRFSFRRGHDDLWIADVGQNNGRRSVSSVPTASAGSEPRMDLVKARASSTANALTATSIRSSSTHTREAPRAAAASVAVWSTGVSTSRASSSSYVFGAYCRDTIRLWALSIRRRHRRVPRPGSTDPGPRRGHCRCGWRTAGAVARRAT